MTHRETMAGTPSKKSDVNPQNRPDPEVDARPRRRQFTAEYKRRILVEADACREPGEVGALLRREGLYSSHLTSWRRQRREGGESGLEPKKRGPRGLTAEQKRLQELERENARLKTRLEKAEKIIDFQKKVAEILEIPLETPPDEKS